MTNHNTSPREFCCNSYFALLLISFFVPASTQVLNGQDWQHIERGMASRVVDYHAEDNTFIQITMVRIDLTYWKPRVLSLYAAMRATNKQYPTYSIRELISTLNPAVVINGGFSTSYSIPIPAGLVLDNKKVISPINAQSATQTGILCITKDGAKIVEKEHFPKGECIYALQAGPILVHERNKLGIFKNEPVRIAKHRRSIIAIDERGRILLLLTSDANLLDLAKYLVKKESENGLECVSALNLSGDIESGLYLRRKDSAETYGNVDVSIASAILFMKK